MQPSILAVLLLPSLLLLGALAKGGIGIVRALRSRQVPGRMTVVAFFSGLLLIDGVLSMVVIIDAALGHSEAAKAASWWYCLALLLVLVAAPAVALFIAIRSVRARNRTSSSGRA